MDFSRVCACLGLLSYLLMPVAIAQDSTDSDLDFLFEDSDTSTAGESTVQPQPGITAEQEDQQSSSAQPTPPINPVNEDENSPATAEQTAPSGASSTVTARRRPNSRLIEEIIVTAQKREQNLRDVPIAISAFSGDTLTELGINSTSDLQRLVPGFNANTSGRNTTLFTLRGVGFTDTTYTATGTVGVYIDEVNLPYSVMTRGANLDIKRVEVLKGPQGTLYGRNTTGGLINYIPNPPTDEFEVGTLTSYGRFNNIESENYISGPLLDSLNGRVAFKVERADGYQISNVRRGSDRLGEKRKFSGRGTLDWTPIDDLFVRLRVEGWLDHSEPTAPQAVGIVPGNPFIGGAGLNPAIANYPFLGDDADPRVADWPIKNPTSDRRAPFPGRLGDRFIMESVKAIWSITDSMDLTTILSHLDQKADDSPQLQGFNITETDLITNARIKTNALEVRLSDTWFGERFYWSVGINLSKDDAFEFQYADTTNAGALFAVGNAVPGVSGPVSDKVDLIGEPTIEQRAIFLNTDTKLTDSLNLNFGIRYSENDENYNFCASEPTDANVDSPAVGLSNVFTALSAQAATNFTLQTGMPGDPRVVVPGDCFSLGEDGNNDPFESELDETNVSGRLAVSWKTQDNSLYYASFSRGFKAGGFPVLNPARKSQLTPVVQEELLAYEIGAKVSFLDSMLNTGFATFYYDYKDKQLLTKVLDDVFGPLPILDNAPKSHIYGVELEAQFAPLQGLFFAFAGSYIKTKIDEFLSTDSEGNPADFKGLPFNFSPEVQLSFLVNYSHPITRSLEAGLGADYYYTSDTNGVIDQNPLFDMDAYKLVGARVFVGAQDKQWTLTLFGRNLTNELANVGTNSFSEAVLRDVAFPRTYGVSLSYRWQ